MIFLHGLKPFQVLGALHVYETCPAPDHEQLADLFLDAQSVQRLLSPLVAARGVDGSGGLGVLVFIFFLGECGQG